MSEFEKARDEASREHNNDCQYAIADFEAGADWAYKWFNKQYNYKITCDRKEEIEVLTKEAEALAEAVESGCACYLGHAMGIDKNVKCDSCNALTRWKKFKND